MKLYKTTDEAQKTKERAVRFVRSVLRDDERADELEAEPLASYARRKRIEIINPRTEGRGIMATKPQLEEALDSVYEKLQEAYDPRLSREEMAEKIGEVLDDLAPEGDGDDDDSEDEDTDDDDE